MSNHDYGDAPNIKTTPMASSRAMQYAQRLTNTRTSPYAAETTTVGHFSPTNRFSSLSDSSETNGTSE